MLEKILQWDRELLIFFNNQGSESVDLFWLITTNFLTWIPFFLFLIIHLARVYKKIELRWVLLNFLSMLICLTAAIFFCKYAVGRLRPVNDTVLGATLRVLIKPNDFSFFSGHAASSFGIITLAYFFLRNHLKWSYFLFLWPLFFSFSRIYLGVHYPSDIFVGSIVGMFFAFIFFRMHRKLRAPYIL
jgi:undecaprenyl-diphosphatase